jgi:hypothetical protein
MSCEGGPLEACKTYIEQTKLLVSLSSAFVVAPAAVAPFLAGKQQALVASHFLHQLVLAEGGFVTSVFMGYIVLATIAGMQHNDICDVHRKATRISSLLQIFSYLFGLVYFVIFLKSVLHAISQ